MELISRVRTMSAHIRFLRNSPEYHQRATSSPLILSLVEGFHPFAFSFRHYRNCVKKIDY